MNLKRLLCVLAFLLHCYATFAIDFSGKYELNTSENRVNLSLSQGNDGSILGSLVSTTGANFSIKGNVDEDVIIGICGQNENSIPFEAHFEDSELSFTLIGDSDQNSKVIKFPISNKSGKHNIDTEPASVKGSEPAADEQQNNVSAKLSMIPNRNNKNASLNKLDGNWICRSGQGDLSLEFITSDVLSFNGDKAEYEIQGDKILVKADGETISYPYSLKNKELKITFPEGVTAIFTKNKISGANSSSANGQIFQQLVGKWKDIRSSGNTIIQLSANGDYSYYSDYVAGNSQAGQANWGYGNTSENKGTWTARGTPQKGTIYYQSQTGEKDTLSYEVHVLRGETFWNEYIFDGKLYFKQ